MSFPEQLRKWPRGRCGLCGKRTRFGSVAWDKREVWHHARPPKIAHEVPYGTHHRNGRSPRSVRAQEAAERAERAVRARRMAEAIAAREAAQEAAQEAVTPLP